MARILLLDPANFTPAERTPWGGSRIAARKASLGVRAASVVGEAWEVSVDPSFPSRVAGSQRTLAEELAAQPDAYLGAEAGAGGTALLLKWLDARERLSLQIHPASDDPLLRAGESGKPEAWYVVVREEGAGIFFGLRSGATRDDLRLMAAGHGGDGIESLLEFVPVEPGDFFVVDAGTPHAIGEGVFVVEPQLVTPGRSGVTYRYWDWGRRYDAAGNLSAGGSLRALQLDDALRVTNEVNAGAAWVASRRVRAGAPSVHEPLTSTPLAGPGSPFPSWPMSVWRLAGSGAAPVPRPGTLLAISVLEGAVTLRAHGESPVRIPAGQSAVVPAAFAAVEAEGEGAHAIAAAVCSSALVP